MNRLLLLAGLVSAIHYGPRWMKTDSAGVQESAPETAPASVVPADFQQIRQKMEQNPNAYSDQERDLAKDVGAVYAQGNGRAPVLENLMRAFSQKSSESMGLMERARSSWLVLKNRYRALQPRIAVWLWLAPLVPLLLGFGALGLSQFSFALWAAEFGCRWSRLWLWLLSGTVVALFLATRSNPWPLVPSELIVPPLYWLAGSALLLRLLDMNHPIWNTLWRGCAFPLASMGLIAALLRFS